MSGGDLERALAHYRRLAARYDHYTRRIERVRLRAIDALSIRPGDVVLDAGCGTGWCLPELARRAGPSGRVIGFDPSPEMLAMARRRVVEGARVEVIAAEGSRVTLPDAPDAILFSYTHDLIRSRHALANLLRQARPGARVAATSTKLYARWLVPANWYLRATHRAYITNFDGFDAPWSLLAEYLDHFHVETGPFTQHYVARGRNKAASDPAAAAQAARKTK